MLSQDFVRFAQAFGKPRSQCPPFQHGMVIWQLTSIYRAAADSGRDLASLGPLADDVTFKQNELAILGQFHHVLHLKFFDAPLVFAAFAITW